MYILDHKPALAMAAASSFIATVHASSPLLVEHVSFVVTLDEWVRLIGGIAGALAGFASAIWYLYSFISARRKKNQ